MSHLRMQVLGGMNVVASGGRAMAIAGSCRPVLGYLLTYRKRQVSKLELAEAIWNEREADHARHCLSTALWRLKKSTGTPLLTFHGGEHVSFNWSAPVWVDAVALETRLSPVLKLKPETLTRNDVFRLKRGLRLYRGDYLSGMDQEWACLERQRLRDIYCDGLYHLTRAHATAQEWDEVLHWGRRLCREEPLREDVHRLLMQACAGTGNRASAIAQYRLCQRVLATELGVEPMEETQALYHQLVRTSAVRTVPTPTPTVELEKVQRRIGRVRRILVICQKQLDQATDTLAHMQSRNS